MQDSATTEAPAGQPDAANHGHLQAANQNNQPYASRAASPVKPATAREIAMGKWFHRHSHATDGFAGYMGYQIFRNICAAIPYGAATAATWMGLEKVATMATAKNVNSNIAKLARSPLRDIAMIAAGFTLFRGTLKVVRYTKERLFNPHHTEEQAIAEVQNIVPSLKETLKEVAPAEVASTPVAAFALGLGRRLWNPVANGAALKQQFEASGISAELAAHEAKKFGVMGLFGKGFAALQTAEKKLNPSNAQTYIRWQHINIRWQHIKNVFSKPGGYWAEAVIVAASFVPFFELSDRRYKDAQVARGIWLNDPASLVRKSDEQAQKELAASEQIWASGNDNKTPDAHAAKAAASLKATGHLRPADQPTLTCFAMRRVVPTFLGIGAYVAGKRLAYLAMGTMPEHNVAGRSWLKNLGMMALVEGAATSLFWLNSSVIDKLEPWYDKHFKDTPPKALNDNEIRRNYESLKARLDAKEREVKSVA